MPWYDWFAKAGNSIADAAVTVGNGIASVGAPSCEVTGNWQPPQESEGVPSNNGVSCPNDAMNGPRRAWSYQCGCQGGADLVCPAGTSPHERTTGHEWCNAHGISTCDNRMCLRKGIACYKKAGDFWSGDPCTDRATKIGCCDPTGNGLDPTNCPPGYCQNSALCKSELFALCNTDAGFAAFPDVCKTFAFKNRTDPSLNVSAVAQKWCAKPGNAGLMTNGYPDVPGGFCSCYTAFGQGSNYQPGAGLDMITGHPRCFNGGCAQYGYADPATINEHCPSNICLQVVDLVARGNITMQNNQFEQKCPGQAVKLVRAQAHATEEQIKAAELERCRLRGDCTCQQLGNCPAAGPAGGPAGGPPPAGTPAGTPPAGTPPADAKDNTKVPPVIVIIIIITVIGIAMSMSATAATAATAAKAALAAPARLPSRIVH